MHLYRNKTVAVLGFGRAGRAAADFFLDAGASIIVYAEGGEPDAAYEDKGVTFHIGTFPERFGADYLVRSPGIRPDIPPIVSSIARGAKLTSETELFFAHTKARIIGVTGSDGKTTTSALIAHLLRAAGHRVYLGGNNGIPLLPLAAKMTATDFAVLELSSFQLMTLQKSPEIAVLTNITPNHLNWHKDMAEYVAAKRRIFEFDARKAVINANLTDIGANASVPTEMFAATERELLLEAANGKERIPVPDTFLLKGQHNRENLAAAYGAVREFVPYGTLCSALADFHGVKHRLQTVDTVGGVTYINSSIDTSPTRTAAALSALDCKPIVIAGGRGKGISLAPLGDTLATRAKALALYGECATEIANAVGGRIPTVIEGEFSVAFRAAAAMARAGDTVLLSPACTAFDQFRDFEARGEAFCALVQELKQK